MAVDLIAQDMAAQALAARPRTPVAFGILGQSNERGNVLPADQAAWPQAFRSNRNPALVAPIGPSVSLTGGWWHHVYDALWDWGYDLHLVNGAIGSASFLTQVAGYLQQRVSGGTGFCIRRPPAGPGDRGDAGDMIQVGGRVFSCTAGGNSRVALNSGPALDASGNAAYADYIMGLNTGGATAATAPDFTTAAVGGTVTDGALTWTRMNEALYAGALNNVLTDSAGSMAGRGFDPLGLMQRLHEDMQRMRGVTRKIVYIANGQTDLGIGAVTYGSALQAIALFFLRRGYDVMIGLTCYSPGSGAASATTYGNLSTGVANAVATLQASWGAGRVMAGANLYQLMGTTGPMGGASLTGAVAGGVLTASAVASGAIEIGHRIARPDGTVIGTVASRGTGTGGAGTYTLTGAADTASQTLRSSGAFLQTVDNVHLNGAGAVGPDTGGVSCAGRHVANAVKAALPRVAR